MTDKLKKLLDKGPVAINMGVEDFAASLEIQGVEVIQVDWVPPAGGDAELIALLDKLL
jgi:hypothetical protein